jgi:hypothetical protein
LRLRLQCAEGISSKNEKTPQSLTAVFLPLREPPEPDNLARFHHT